MPKIFISYRYDDSKHAAGRLALEFYRLGRRTDVYFDKAGKRGVEFVPLYEAEARKADVVFALISADWNENRRLEHEGNHVRRELLAARERQVSVVPVLVDATEQPNVSELPSVLEFLFGIPCEKLRHESFEHDAIQLFRIACELAEGRAMTPPLSSGLRRQFEQELTRVREFQDRRDLARVPPAVRPVIEMVEELERAATESQYRARSAAGELTDDAARRAKRGEPGTRDMPVNFVGGLIGRYVGEVEGVRQNGYGEQTYTDADGATITTRGQWKDDRRAGFYTRVIVGSDGSATRFEGELHEGKQCEIGVRFVNRAQMLGEFRDGRLDGMGVYVWEDGRRFEGEWQKGLRHDLGAIWSSDGSMEKAGKWQNDVFVDS